MNIFFVRRTETTLSQLYMCILCILALFIYTAFSVYTRSAAEPVYILINCWTVGAFPYPAPPVSTPTPPTRVQRAESRRYQEPQNSLTIYIYLFFHFFTSSSFLFFLFPSSFPSQPTSTHYPQQHTSSTTHPTTFQGSRSSKDGRKNQPFRLSCH